MRKFEKKTTVLGVLIIVVFFALGLAAFFKSPAYGQQHSITFIAPPYLQKMQRIIITYPHGNSLAFTRINDRFRLDCAYGEYYMTEARQDQLFDILCRTRTYTVVSEGHSAVQQYGLDDGRSVGIQIEADDGRTMLDVQLGFASAGGQYRFIRINGRALVLQTRDDFGLFLAARVHTWVSPQIFAAGFSDNGVQAVSEEGRQFFRTPQTEKHFFLLEETLSGLFALDIFPQPLEHAERCVELEFGNGKKSVLCWKKQVSGDYALWVNGSGYVVSEQTARRLEYGVNVVLPEAAH